MHKEVELSDGRKVSVETDGDHWILKIFGEDGLLDDTYEEHTFQKIDPEEEKIAALLTRFPGATVGPKFPGGGKWLTETHNVDWDDAMLVARVISGYIFGSLSNLLDD